MDEGCRQGDLDGSLNGVVAARNRPKEGSIVVMNITPRNCNGFIPGGETPHTPEAVPSVCLGFLGVPSEPVVGY
jgi:hypothetical protein